VFSAFSRCVDIVYQPREYSSRASDIRNVNICFARAKANLYALTLNLLRRLDDATRANVPLMGEATIDSAQLLRLLDARLLRQATENVRMLFASLGGALPSVLNVAPIEKGGRLFALANRLLQRSVEPQNVHAPERDPFAKAYRDLLSALNVAQRFARQLRNGLPLRNRALVAQRVRDRVELFRAFRLHARLKLTPSE
jgi:hypothetical protein